MRVHLRIAGGHAADLRTHLFPGDGLEAVALILCGIHRGPDTTSLCSRDVFPIPHNACSVRRPDLVSWPTAAGLPAFTRALNEELAVVKIHSHPGGFAQFSAVDDQSDHDLLSSLAGWTQDDIPNASVIMLPCGSMIGRTRGASGLFTPLASILIAGSDIRIFSDDIGSRVSLLEADERNRQTFGVGTVRLLKSLRVGIAGCSGTGSWIVEMLGRLGVGHLVLVDPDRLELRNLNRIVGSNREDADHRRLKVDVMRRSIEGMGFGTLVTTHPLELASSEVIQSLATCDILFGCLDSADGRDILNRISSAYCIPYFDVGVRLDADGKSGISYVGGAVNYVQPGGSSLLSRRVITSESISAAELRRRDPDEFRRRVAEGYIRGVRVDSPAVSSINGFHAALAVNDFLARLHSFRLSPNKDADAILSNVTDTYLQPSMTHEPCRIYGALVGRGDQTPLLGLVGI